LPRVVAELEGQATSNPAQYRLKVLLLAMLGNAYLAGILLLIVALLGAAVASVAVLKGFAVKIILVIGAFLWLIVKAVWIRIPPPEGIEIDEAQAPELFAMIEALRQALRAPAFHHVLVVDEFNAGVVQTPNFGPFGGNRNYLLIGLPLMKALTVDQFRAVLAHEFGHLANGHGRWSNWIYRQRLRWDRLMGLLDANESQGRVLFKPFLRWFTPYFNAYSFPLARANEYEADASLGPAHVSCVSRCGADKRQCPWQLSRGAVLARHPQASG
jgi:Zn-dependent protease with chaperone function